MVTNDLPISPRFTPYDFLSRCKFSNLTTRQPMVEFYFLAFLRLPLRKEEHKSYFGENRTHDFRTSRCVGYLLDHSGDSRGKTGNGRESACRNRNRRRNILDTVHAADPDQPQQYRYSTVQYMTATGKWRGKRRLLESCRGIVDRLYLL